MPSNQLYISTSICLSVTNFYLLPENTCKYRVNSSKASCSSIKHMYVLYISCMYVYIFPIRRIFEMAFEGFYYISISSRWTSMNQISKSWDQNNFSTLELIYCHRSYVTTCFCSGPWNCRRQAWYFTKVKALACTKHCCHSDLEIFNQMSLSTSLELTSSRYALWSVTQYRVVQKEKENSNHHDSLS